MIDAAERSAMRETLKRGYYPPHEEVLALLDELETARSEGQCQYDENVSQIVRYAALEAELENTAALHRELVKICGAGDSLDGGMLQDMLVKYGVIVLTTVEKPCSAWCNCDHNDAVFPTTCYRLAVPQLEHVRAVEKAKDTEIARLREALMPFAEYAAWVSENHPGWDHDDFSVGLPDGMFSGSDADRLGPYRRARAALKAVL